MRKIVVIAAIVALALPVAGCGGRRAGVFAGGKRGAPDEFAVSRQAPLVIPPDFALTPPRPGAPRPQEADSSTQALQAMFGGPAPRSPGEAALLGQAGAINAAPGIRSNVADPATVTADKGQTTRDILAAPTGNGETASATTPQ